MDNIFRVKKNVLVVSGEPRALAEIKKGLRDSFEIVLASTTAAASDALNGHGIDAVVICLGSASGITEICELSAGEKIPVLFLDEQDDERAERDAFAKFNAADYFVRRGENYEAFVNRLRLRILAGENRRLIEDRKNISAQGKVILIAEDVALNREIMNVMLSETEGLSVEFADNGLEAVEKFKKNAEIYKLILMDIHMPKMDGLAAAKTIRRLGSAAAKNIPIFALTAGTGGDDIAGFAEAGMNGYLEKPIDYDKLMEVINYFM